MKILFAIFLFLLSFIGLAQKDSIMQRSVLKSELCFDLSDSLRYTSFDSTLSKFYYVEKDGRSLTSSLGNSGLSSDFLTFQFLKHGFSDGENHLGNYYDKYSPNTIYKTNIPVARISYINGAQSLQDFDLLFTENINPRLNLTVQVGSFSSKGFYLNQDVKQKLFNIQSSYLGKAKRYGYFLRYSVNSGVLAENGGIRGDSLYESVINGSKLGVQVWLENSKNHYDKREFTLNQFYGFKQINDSLNPNSSNGSFIGLNSHVYTNDIWYEDQLSDSGYYSKFGVNTFDSNLVSDKSNVTGAQNSLFFKFKFSNSPLNIKVGFSGNGYNVNNLETDTLLYEGSLFTEINDFKLGPVSLFAKAKIGLIGFNENGYDYKLEVRGNLLSDYLGYSVRGEILRSLPDYNMLNYSGSAIRWANAFESVDQRRLDVSVFMKDIGLSLSGEMYGVSNYVYLNSLDASPKQYDGSFVGYKFDITKSFQLKSYHFDIKVVNQGVDVKAPVNLPRWLMVVSFYYQRYLFKDALELRYGIDFWQNSSYYANDYLPFNRNYAVQNEYKVGDYPFVNFYISARVKSAQGFVNFQNIGQIFLDKSYMMTPYYPMQDFAMSFGIRWDFYN